MSRLILVICLVIAAFAGSFAGGLHPVRHPRAVTAIDLYVNPGSATNLLTCGWHSTCQPPFPWGNALDWGNWGGAAVYWRSWAIASPNQGAIGYAYAGDSGSPTCYGTSVDIYDTWWAWRGRVVYLHTQSTGTSRFMITSGPPPSGTLTVSGPLGTTVSREKSSSCPWSAAHLHQYSTASGWYANTNVYPPAPATGTGYQLNDIGYWQNRTFWYR